MKSDEQPAGQLVWMPVEELRQGVVRHPRFSEDIRKDIRRIQKAFGEFVSLSLEAWELGFRRDVNPTQEIAVWLHAAVIYGAVTKGEPCRERRREMFTCVIACAAFDPYVVQHVLRAGTLTSAEVEQIIRMFFRKST